MILSVFAWVIASSGSWGSICYGFLVTLGICRCLDGLEQQWRFGLCWWLFVADSGDIVRGSFTYSPWVIVKGYSSGLFVAYGSPSCVGCAAPDCGLGVWCLLVREPPSGWIPTMGTSLPASKWTSVKNHCVISCHWDSIVIDWLHLVIGSSLDTAI